LPRIAREELREENRREDAKWLLQFCRDISCLSQWKHVIFLCLLTVYELHILYCFVEGLLSFRLLSRNVKVKIYRTIILPVVLYGYESWSLTLREEHKLRVFENRVLRRILAPKRYEVTGE
jgi:hypothetical protein